MKDYTIATGASSGALRREVNRLMGAHYEPVGGLTEFAGMLMQAMVLDSPEPKPEALPERRAFDNEHVLNLRRALVAYAEPGNWRSNGTKDPPVYFIGNGDFSAGWKIATDALAGRKI